MKLMFLVCFYTPSPKSFNKKPSKARDVIIGEKMEFKTQRVIGRGCLFIRPHACWSVRMSVGPSVCTFVCPPVYPFVRLSVSCRVILILHDRYQQELRDSKPCNFLKILSKHKCSPYIFVEFKHFHQFKYCIFPLRK